jgi:hypothetical protein
MVIPHSYGKHCSNATAGAPVNRSDALLCPDRTDCADVNNDALLMSGYLCHPCLPNICDEDEVCVNLPYEGVKCTSTTLTANDSTTTTPPFAAAVNPGRTREEPDVQGDSFSVAGHILIFFSFVEF